MALMQCSFFSEVLGLSSSMNVIVPQAASGQIGMEGKGGAPEHGYPTLFLLHGLSDDHSIWLRRTSIERYVSALGLAVVMPAVGRSFYADMVHGERYWTFISEELPRVARGFFRLSSRREDNFVAGLSMGGYGAFKLALNCPDRFSAAASLSGALFTRPELLFDDANERADLFRHVFGDVATFEGSSNDLLHALDNIETNGTPKPRLLQCCGTEDFLYETNCDFRRAVEPRGFDYTWEEEPGSHEWGYWDRKIQRVLEWLALPGAE